jgi:hypothetical protein
MNADFWQLSQSRRRTRRALFTQGQSVLPLMQTLGAAGRGQAKTVDRPALRDSFKAFETELLVTGKARQLRQPSDARM